MDRTERFYKICELLNGRRNVSRRMFLDELGVSHATFKRDLEYLRERMRAPILWDRDAGGYRFDKSSSRRFELPGLWFNDSEVYALLAMEHLLENLTPGLLTPHIEPMRAQIKVLLGSGTYSVDEVVKRIRVVTLAARRLKLPAFETGCAALLARKRLRITHYNRLRAETTEREVSPQRLVHYRDNWYLDTYCHLREDLRTFSVDAISNAELLKTRCKSVSETALDEYAKSGYGIFTGRARATAVLRFTPERARWVSREKWHPKQKSRFDADGGYVLEVPYSDDRELLMDILKYGPDVEVLAPAALRQKVTSALKAAAGRYGP